MTPSSSSRPRDAAGTRLRIETVARRLFTQLGYRATTVADIAAAAEVSPNLITRYFGGKDGVFLAATRPEVAADGVYDAALPDFGSSLARSIVTRWTSQPDEDPLLALLRASGERPEAARQLTAFLDAHSTARLRQYFEAQGVPTAHAESRALAIDAFILGVTVRRRVLTDDLGDIAVLEHWLADALQQLAGGRAAPAAVVAAP